MPKFYRSLPLLLTLLLSAPGCIRVYVPPAGQADYRKQLLECEEREEQHLDTIDELLRSIDELEQCP